MEIFDLTTRNEMQKFLMEHGDLVAPPDFLGKLVLKLFATFMGSKAAAKQQSLAAEQLIQKGKENGVDEMEIIVNNNKGFHFESPTEEGVKIDITIGKDGKMHIKVKYK
jgi:hypothetical protein